MGLRGGEARRGASRRGHASMAEVSKVPVPPPFWAGRVRRPSLAYWLSSRGFDSIPPGKRKASRSGGTSPQPLTVVARYLPAGL
jgi:hypothetical protein